MSHKSYNLYFHLFNSIKNILNSNNMNVNFEKITFTLDFEKAARKALNEIFPESNIIGCYFHFIKALWLKAKKLGLISKKLIKDTIILIFAYKIYCFIPKNYLDDIELKFKEKKEYEHFIKYFKKNWAGNKFLDIQYINRKENLEKTNNTCELFHRNLINIIDSYHPKIEYFVDKIKNYTINIFQSSEKDLVLINDKESINKNIYENIFSYVKKIFNKYKIPITFNLLIQLDKSETQDLYNISMNAINCFLNFKNGIDLNLNDIEHSENNNNDIFQELNNIEPEIISEEKQSESNDDEGITSNKNENIFENKIFNKKLTKVKYEDNDFHELYKEESVSIEIIKKKKNKKK